MTPDADSTAYGGATKASWPKRLGIVVVLAAVAGAGWWYYRSSRPNTSAAQFRTAPVARGDVIQEVTANGALNPVKNVEVGSQVSGIISKLYVDFNAPVKEGDKIAQIDPSTYQQNLLQAEAELANAQAALELARVNSRRAEELFKNKLISASEHDTARAAFQQAQAVVQVREASVFRAKVDLSRTTITAPIDGVVISRAVDEGQTVAASFNTPRLFVIANDLSKMQIEAAVSEADVGGIEEGQPVSFLVEAFPNRKFYGEVQQVRYAPVTNQNVVTYTTVVAVSNPDLKLRPGMTAIAKIVTAEKKNVLRIPNAALRFRPPPGVTVQTPPSASGSTNPVVILDSSGVPVPPWRTEGRRPTPEEREKFEASLTPEQRDRFQHAMQQMRQRSAEGGGPGGGGRPGAGARKPDGPTPATVYLLSSDEKQGKEPVLKPVTITTGISDGATTEVIDGLEEGDVLVTGIVPVGTTTASSSEPPRNPFSPFGGRPPRR